MLSQGTRLVLIGVAAGLLASVLSTHALSRVFLLVGVNDPATFAAVTAALSAIALIACYLPAP